MPQSLRDRIVANFNEYEKFIERTVKDLRRSLIFDILFTIVAPVVIGIVAYFIASVAALVAAFSVGGVNALEKFTVGQTMLKTYRSDCARLKGSVLTLKLDINECDESDKACLLAVNKKMKGFIKAISPPPGQPSPEL